VRGRDGGQSRRSSDRDRENAGVNASDHELPPVCILAGGLGTRLGDHVRDVPKPLLVVAGEPFLFHQLRLLERAGARRVVLCVGYRGKQIEDVVGEEKFGIRISYSYDAPGLDGTLGAIRRALPFLGERFLTLYGDTYLRIDYRAFDTLWQASRQPGAMAVLRNRGKWGSSNAVLADGLVVRYDKGRQTSDMEWIDYGLGGLTVRALDVAGAGQRDLADLHRVLADRHLLYGFEAENRFYEIGTPEALQETDRFLRDEGVANRRSRR
jgi:NDP-sugar pyrophosphorylase family protein